MEITLKIGEQCKVLPPFRRKFVVVSHIGDQTVNLCSCKSIRLFFAIVDRHVLARTEDDVWYMEKKILCQPFYLSAASHVEMQSGLERKSLNLWSEEQHWMMEPWNSNSRYCGSSSGTRAERVLHKVVSRKMRYWLEEVQVHILQDLSQRVMIEIIPVGFYTAWNQTCGMHLDRRLQLVPQAEWIYDWGQLPQGPAKPLPKYISWLTWSFSCKHDPFPSGFVTFTTTTGTAPVGNTIDIHFIFRFCLLCLRSLCDDERLFGFLWTCEDSKQRDWGERSIPTMRSLKLTLLGLRSRRSSVYSKHRESRIIYNHLEARSSEILTYLISMTLLGLTDWFPFLQVGYGGCQLQCLLETIEPYQMLLPHETWYWI